MNVCSCNCHNDVAFFGCAKEIVTSFGYVMMYVLGGQLEIPVITIGNSSYYHVPSSFDRSCL
jgi:hypothetical protein